MRNSSYRKLFFGVLSTFLLVAGKTVVAQDYRISNVEFKQNNVFPEEANGVQKAANNFHFTTRQKVIAGIFLQKPGDILDLELLEESERRLRYLDFLGRAEINIDTVSTQEVNITVETWDQWSLEPAFVLESGGGLTGLGLGLAESNFLGYGKLLFVEAYNESDAGTQWSVGYSDPMVRGTRWTTDLLLTTGPLFEGAYLDINRPYFANDEKWSGGASGLIENEIQRIFQGGQEVSRSRYEGRAVAFDGEYSYGERYRKKRFNLEYRYEQRNFMPIQGETIQPLPENEVISATTGTFSIQNYTFTKETHVDKFIRIEDITLGYRLLVAVGKAGFPVATGVDRWEYTAAYRHYFSFGNDHLLFLRGDFESWVEKNTILSLQTGYYYQPSRWGTLAINVEMDVSEDLESTRQFVVGGESGLRGYRAREFSGDKRFLANVEMRLFPEIYLLTVEIGAVAFIDAGTAWKRNEDIDFGQLNYSTGLGVRLGFTKSPGSPVFRFDVGWPLSRDGGPGVAFGINQAFEY